jgi:hypothetical protein
MSKPRAFKQINTADRDLQLIQSNIENAISQVISSALLNGRLINDISLVSGSNKVEHKLNRVPQGYIITEQNASTIVYASAKDDKFISLESSVTCKVSLWIF